MLQQNKHSIGSQEVDENHAVQAHQQFYGGGGGGGGQQAQQADSGSMGSAAAMQALKVRTTPAYRKVISTKLLTDVHRW